MSLTTEITAMRISTQRGRRTKPMAAWVRGGAGAAFHKDSRMKPGTLAHRDLFCRWFVDTHVAFEPEALPWPDLDPTLLARLRAFPFWSYARTIEQRAGRMVSAFARTIDDPVIRDAVALQGTEETRHGRLMTHVTERYGIDAPLLAIPDPPAVKDDFVLFGFGECADSFVGFGALSLVRRKELFPEPLIAIFDDVMFEEARHVVFFINWWRYEQAREGRDGLVTRTADALRVHARALAGTASSATSNGPKIDIGEMRGWLEGLTAADFLAAALTANHRIMERFDPRLIRPRLIPTIAMLAWFGLQWLPPRGAVPAKVKSRPRLVA